MQKNKPASQKNYTDRKEVCLMKWVKLFFRRSFLLEYDYSRLPNSLHVVRILPSSADALNEKKGFVLEYPYYHCLRRNVHSFLFCQRLKMLFRVGVNFLLIKW